jgi:hypothetical protein
MRDRNKDDFLSTLVDRAQGMSSGTQAHLIERRRPSLFEPVGGAGQLNAPSFASAAWLSRDPQVFEESDREETREVPAPLFPPPFVRKQPQKMATRLTRVEQVEKKLNQEPPAPRQTKFTHAKPNSSASNAGPRVVESITEKEIVQPAPVVRVRKAQQIAEIEDADQMTPTPVVPAVRPASRERNQEAEINNCGSRGLLEDRLAPSVFGPQYLIPASAQPPTTRTTIQPVRKSPDIPRNARQEPTIHVTIGRVEIRATTTAPPASRTARPAGPKLDLEQYLKSRGGPNR